MICWSDSVVRGIFVDLIRSEIEEIGPGRILYTGNTQSPYLIVCQEWTLIYNARAM